MAQKTDDSKAGKIVVGPVFSLHTFAPSVHEPAIAISYSQASCIAMCDDDLMPKKCERFDPSKLRIDELKELAKKTSVKEIVSLFRGNSIPETEESFQERIRKMRKSDRAMMKALYRFSKEKANSPVKTDSNKLWSKTEKMIILHDWAKAMRKENKNYLFAAEDAIRALSLQTISAETLETEDWEEWQKAILDTVAYQLRTIHTTITNGDGGVIEDDDLSPHTSSSTSPEQGTITDGDNSHVTSKFNSESNSPSLGVDITGNVTQSKEMKLDLNEEFLTTDGLTTPPPSTTAAAVAATMSIDSEAITPKILNIIMPQSSMIQQNNVDDNNGRRSLSFSEKRQAFETQHKDHSGSNNSNGYKKATAVPAIAANSIVIKGSSTAEDRHEEQLTDHEDEGADGVEGGVSHLIRKLDQNGHTTHNSKDKKNGQKDKNTTVNTAARNDNNDDSNATAAVMVLTSMTKQDSLITDQSEDSERNNTHKPAEEEEEEDKLGEKEANTIHLLNQSVDHLAAAGNTDTPLPSKTRIVHRASSSSSTDNDHSSGSGSSFSQSYPWTFFTLTIFVAAFALAILASFLYPPTMLPPLPTSSNGNNNAAVSASADLMANMVQPPPPPLPISDSLHQLGDDMSSATCKDYGKDVDSGSLAIIASDSAYSHSLTSTDNKQHNNINNNKNHHNPHALARTKDLRKWGQPLRNFLASLHNNFFGVLRLFGIGKKHQAINSHAKQA